MKKQKKRDGVTESDQVTWKWWCGVRTAYIGILIPIVTVIGGQRTSVVGEKGERNEPIRLLRI